MQCEAMERRPGSRVLSVILVGTGICALALSMWMNARFGWAQADALEDRTVMAGLHTLADPAAAALGAAGGVFLAWGWRWHGFGTILFAFAFIAWSMVSVYGFMATRIAASEGHKNSIKVQERYLSWVQGQTVNFDLPKSERHAMKDEVKATVHALPPLPRCARFDPEPAGSSGSPSLALVLPADRGTTCSKVVSIAVEQLRRLGTRITSDTDQ